MPTPPAPTPATPPTETPRQVFWGNVVVVAFCVIVGTLIYLWQSSGDSCETVSHYYAGYHDSYQSCTDDDTGEHYVLP